MDRLSHPDTYLDNPEARERGTERGAQSLTFATAHDTRTKLIHAVVQH